MAKLTTGNVSVSTSDDDVASLRTGNVVVSTMDEVASVQSGLVMLSVEQGPVEPSTVTYSVTQLAHSTSPAGLNFSVVQVAWTDEKDPGEARLVTANMMALAYEEPNAQIYSVTMQLLVDDFVEVSGWGLQGEFIQGNRVRSRKTLQGGDLRKRRS